MTLSNWARAIPAGTIDLGGGVNTLVATGSSFTTSADILGVQNVTIEGSYIGDILLEEGDGAAAVEIGGGVGANHTGGTSYYQTERYKISLTDADDTVTLGTKGSGTSIVGHTEIDLGGGTNLLKIYAESWQTNYFTLKGTVSRAARSVSAIPARIPATMP